MASESGGIDGENIFKSSESEYIDAENISMPSDSRDIDAENIFMASESRDIDAENIFMGSDSRDIDAESIIMVSESPDIDGENITVVVEPHRNDHENLPSLKPSGFSSSVAIVTRPILNFYKFGGGNIIDRDTVFYFNGEERRQGETSPNEDEQIQKEKSGGHIRRDTVPKVSSKKQREIKKAVMIIGSNMESVVANIKPVLKSQTIYKVPKHLKDVYGSTSFEPKLVGLGPFHHFKKKFQHMYAHKWRFFHRFLNSMNDSTSTTSTAAAESSNTTDVATHDKKIECLFVALKKLEASTRACYSQNFHQLDSLVFVQMMMIDGCFIIELLRLCEKLGKENVVDPLFRSRWTIPNLRHDLLMLENQLPFPVLQTLFEMSIGSGNVDQHHSLKYLILNFFDLLLPRGEKVLDQVLTVVRDKKPHHLLDFFRSSFHTEQDTNRIRRKPYHLLDFFRSSFRTSNDDQDRLVLIHSVTELKEAGIEFKKRENHNLLDIEFKNGKLYIPPLLIDDNTSSVFLNFLVYEQSDQFLEPYFTNYLLFLDGLVDSSTDIEHLHYKGIIDHVLSSNEQVAELFNKLCKDAVHDLADNYLSNVLKDVNRYTSRRWNRWRAAWGHTYFKNPWAFSSFLAAVFLLILTTIQTFFSVYGYFAPPA